MEDYFSALVTDGLDYKNITPKILYKVRTGKAY